MEGNPAFTPIYPDTLSYEDKMKALDSVNLITYKRNGIIKVRICADDRKKVLKGRRKHIIIHGILGGSILHSHG